MNRYYITEIDSEANKSRVMNYEVAIRNVVKYIQKNIDKTFPEDKFMKWINRSDEKPFRHNKKFYYWTNE